MSDFFGIVFKIFGLGGKDELSQALSAEELYIVPGFVNLIIILVVLLFYYKIVDKPSNANRWSYFLYSILGAILSLVLILLYLNFEFSKIDYEFTIVNAFFFALSYNLFFYYFFFFILSILFARMSTNCKNIPLKWR